MPKQESTRTNSFKSRTHASPYASNGSSSHQRVPSSSTSPKPTQEETKEWEEARCSVCMEHPHNAVLLTCTSIKKGCRPFMCDTSYRHSNCLDQYKKAFTKISCPLCRGCVDGWSVDKSARRYMDSKIRSCSKESCGFSGTYLELRKHARKEHPLDRPSTADPERQQDWQRMVQRRDFEDLMSTMRGELNSEEDGGGGLERLFNEDDNEVGLVGRLRISPIAVLLLIRYTFRMDESLELVSSPRRSPPSSSAVVSHAGEDSNNESSDPEYVNEENEAVVRERRRRTREILRRRMSTRFPDYESDDASEEAVRVRRRLMRLSPVAESDDDDGSDRVQDRPRRRRMRLLPDDDGDDEEEEENDDSIDRVEERPRRRRMRLPDDESDDYS